MRAAPTFIAALLALAALGVGAHAERRAAVLTVSLNETPVVGAQIVYLDDRDALVPVELLRGAGLALRGGIVEQIDGVDHVALASLPLRFAVDEDRMTLHLTAAPEDLPAARIDLRSRRQPTELTRDAAASLYVNYGVHAVGARLSGAGEAGLRIGDALAYSAVTVLPDHTIVRGLSHLVLDDHANLRQIIEGDQIVTGGPLGGGGVVGGLHVVRSFELDPYLVTAPSLDLSGSVLAPATAEIYVNGVMVRRAQLTPGRYTLANLPVTSGSGDTRVVIRDALGRQQELAQSHYMPRGLLRPGLSDYHVAAGAMREQLGRASFDYGTGVVSARYRRGLTANLTAGVSGELTEERGNAGGSVGAGTAWGQLEGALAMSSDRGTRGAAGSLAWSYVAPRGSLALFGRRVSARYATIDLDRDGARPITELRVQGSLPLHRKVAIGAQLGAIEQRDGGWSERAAVQLTATLGRGTTLAVQSGRETPWREAPRYDVFAQLTMSLAGRTRGSLSHRRRARGETNRLELQRSLGNEDGLGYRAYAEAGPTARAGGSVQAQTAFGRYELVHTHDERQGGTTEVRATGGLAWIGGRVFASPPIDRSFALVRVPGVGGVRASLEHRPVGRTDARGDLFLRNLQPYYGNTIQIDPTDLPFERSVPVTRQIVAPPARGGSVITFHAPLMRIVRGQLRVITARGPQPPAYGELEIASPTTAISSPIASDGAFELEGLVAGRHLATITWEGGMCRFELVVPPGAVALVDVGATVCRMPAREAAR